MHGDAQVATGGDAAEKDDLAGGGAFDPGDELAAIVEEHEAGEAERGDVVHAIGNEPLGAGVVGGGDVDARTFGGGEPGGGHVGAACHDSGAVARGQAGFPVVGGQDCGRIPPAVVKTGGADVAHAVGRESAVGDERAAIRENDEGGRATGAHGRIDDDRCGVLGSGAGEEDATFCFGLDPGDE